MRIVEKTGLGVWKLYKDTNLPQHLLNVTYWDLYLHILLSLCIKLIVKESNLNGIPRCYLCSRIMLFYILGIINITSNALAFAYSILWAKHISKNVCRLKALQKCFSQLY